MDATMILVAAAAVVAVASIGIAFVALNKFRGKEVSEYTDAAKLGKTRTLKSFRSNGSISWEDFFDPDSQENE